MEKHWERLDGFEYPWQFAGENLGEGQTSLMRVLGWLAWQQESLQNVDEPNMKEMAVARYKNYWVQHFEQNHLQVPKENSVTEGY